MTQNKLAKGLRWELPFIIIDAILYATQKKFQMVTESLMNSNEVQTILYKNLEKLLKLEPNNI